jgi:hypothetical protein
VTPGLISPGAFVPRPEDVRAPGRDNARAPGRDNARAPGRDNV